MTERTVCIAIACESYWQPPPAPKFILLADQMISSVTSSSQVGIKIRFLANGWFSMFAGNDVSMAQDIIAIATASMTGSSLTIFDVMENMRAAYQSVRRQKIQDSLLSSYNWDMTYFLQNGRRLLGQAAFGNLLYQIDTFDLGCSFLVCGFNNSTSPVAAFFQVDNPGNVTPQGLTGYAAIGSGAPNALSYLDWRGQSWADSVGSSLYNGIAAKSLAEKALSVGPATIGLIATRDASYRILTPQEIGRIKDMWLSEEANVRPANISERVSAILGG